MEGEVVCLPLKEKNTIQDSDCPYGIKTQDNEYYALDTGLMSSTPQVYAIGDKIKANGVITPIENLSTDHWQKYNVKGIFSVTDSFKKL